MNAAQCCHGSRWATAGGGRDGDGASVTEKGGVVEGIRYNSHAKSMESWGEHGSWAVLEGRTLNVEA